MGGLLLVDDGSTDGSTAIAKSYARQHADRVRYLEHPRHENRGMPAARNLGIRHARGRYVAFLDADDIWLPHKLAQQVEIMETYPEAGMICGATQWWYGWTCRPEDIKRDFIAPVTAPPDTVVYPPQLAIDVHPLGGGMGAHASSSILTRREVLERVGGYDEQFRGIHHMYEDQAFLIKLYLTTPIYVAGACWHRWRQHPLSFSAGTASAAQQRFGRKFFLDWLETYLFRCSEENVAVWRALRRAQWQNNHPLLNSLLQFADLTAQNIGKPLLRFAAHVLPRTIYMELLDWARSNRKRYLS